MDKYPSLSQYDNIYIYIYTNAIVMEKPYEVNIL